MILKIHEILPFQEFYSLAASTHLPIKTSYKFARMATAIEKNVEFYQTSFRNIVSEFAQVDENGNFIPTEDGQGVKIKEGTEIECNTRLMELNNLDVELPDIKFTIDELEGCELTPAEMVKFLPFIED
jgi:hypothetical protein